MTSESVAFWVLATIATAGALGVVTARKAVYSALFLAATMIALAVLYVAQGALFLGVVQVVVYTGAVMMLFLFVVMLVGVDASDTLIDTIRGQRWMALLLGVGLAMLLITSIGSVAFGPAVGLDEANAGGNVTNLAGLIFGPYVWVFEVTSALLITAALAAMVLAHRERLLPKPTQREWSERRIRDNRYVAGLPPPGVYARHNAVDTPALLPDGTPSQLSVSRVLDARRQVAAPTRFSQAEREIEREIEEGSAR